MKAWILLRAEWDRALGVLLIAVGGVGLLLGYRGVSESVFVGQQLAYVVSGGLGGLFLGAVGVALLVCADLHDEWRKLDRIESAMRGDVVADATDVLLEAKSTPAGSVPVSTGKSRSLRVTAFSKTALPHPMGPDGPIALTIDWAGDRLRQALMAVLGAVVLTAAVIAGGWGGAARSTTAVDGFRPVLVAGTAVAVGLLALSVYPVWLRGRLTQRKRTVLGEWLSPTKADQVRPARVRSDRAEPTTASLVVADGLHRSHVSGCPTLTGMATRPLEAESADALLPPCRICQPA